MILDIIAFVIKIIYNELLKNYDIMSINKLNNFNNNIKRAQKNNYSVISVRIIIFEYKNASSIP